MCAWLPRRAADVPGAVAMPYLLRGRAPGRDENTDAPDSQVLFVGDPGQLDPFATVDTDRWHGLSWDPLCNAVDVTLAHEPNLLRRQLPISWRLPAMAAPSWRRPSPPTTPLSRAPRRPTAF